jgi:hypothetical protein
MDGLELSSCSGRIDSRLSASCKIGTLRGHVGVFFLPLEDLSRRVALEILGTRSSSSNWLAFSRAKSALSGDSTASSRGAFERKESYLDIFLNHMRHVTHKSPAKYK